MLVPEKRSRPEPPGRPLPKLPWWITPRTTRSAAQMPREERSAAADPVPMHYRLTGVIKYSLLDHRRGERCYLGVPLWLQSIVPGLASLETSFYLPRCVSAKRSGALDISISPPNGAYISRIKKIAPETDNPETNKAAVTVALRGAKRPKLTKIAVSQKTKITSIGLETEVAPCANISQRVWPRPIAILNAWAFNERWVSSFGDSAWILSRTTSAVDGGTTSEV